MKVILREDVKNLGKKGDVIEVAEGYGRNYLIPRGLAVPASEGKLKEAALIQEGRARKEARARQEAEAAAARLKGLTLTIASRAGEGGRLYGAVTSRDVARELEKLLGRAVDRRKIELSEPIKTLGTFPVLLRLHPGVEVEIKVSVVAANP
ncbi:MAG: 50S ribosomal protein L9 [Firmicutes bacterium]|nr:50S ribosomal protein L9 [Bacillota bacterium]